MEIEALESLTHPARLSSHATISDLLNIDLSDSMLSMLVCVAYTYGPVVGSCFKRP